MEDVSAAVSEENAEDGYVTDENENPAESDFEPLSEDEEDSAEEAEQTSDDEEGSEDTELTRNKRRP